MADPDKDNENQELDEDKPVPPPPFEPKPPWSEPPLPDPETPPRDEWTAWTLGKMRDEIHAGTMDAWLPWLAWAYDAHYWIHKWVKARAAA
jgi:hypothetical protein